MSEIYKLPQGKIIIAFCNESLSIGLLELDPKQELPKHKRPVKEDLVQIHGHSIMKIFDGDKIVKKILLKKNEKAEISENIFHIHSNPTDKKSITLWKFEGDIRDVIENIKNNSERIF